MAMLVVKLRMNHYEQKSKQTINVIKTVINLSAHWLY